MWRSQKIKLCAADNRADRKCESVVNFLGSKPGDVVVLGSGRIVRLKVEMCAMSQCAGKGNAENGDVS
jgi:hypothetical protein